MEIVIFFTGIGGSNICGPISDRLDLELGDYGSAVETIWLNMYAGKTAGKLTADEKARFKKLPRRSFNRNKKQITGHHHYQAFCEADEQFDGYSVEKTNLAIPEVIEALQFLQTAVKEVDDFDFESFLTDAKAILRKPFKTVKQMKAANLELFERMQREAQESIGEAELDCDIHTYAMTVDEKITANYTTDHVTFVNQFSCIVDLFEGLIQYRYRGALQMLTIELVTPEQPCKLLAEAVLGWPFDFDNYSGLNEFDKKKRIAVTMRDALIWLAKERNQDPKYAEVAFAEIESLEFQRTRELKTSIPGGRGELVARLDYEHNLDGIELFATFTKPRSRKPLGRVSLGLCPYRPWLLQSLPRFCSWKGTKFLIDIEPIPWSASVDARKVIAKKT